MILSAPVPSGDHNRRPRFESAEDWLQHYRTAIQHRQQPWPAASRDELLLADAHGILDTNQHWIPCAAQLRHWGLPLRFGRPQQPYSETFKERLLTTFQSDSELRAAFRSVFRENPKHG